MENMKQKTIACHQCGNFCGYYTKAPSRFVRAKVGYCKKCGKVVDNSDSCEWWYKCNRKRCASKKIALKVLSDLLENISNIKQILQEAQEEGVGI